MSYNFNFIVIEGDYRDNVAQWCKSAGYLVETTPNDGMPTFHVSSTFTNGRTLIHDSSIFDESLLVQLSASIESRIVQVACGGTADSYGFQCYDKARTVRVLWVLESELLEDTGQPIDEENGLVFDSSTSEAEMLALASRLGFDPNGDYSPPDFYLTSVHQHASVPETAGRLLGRVFSTLICAIVASCLFKIAPRTKELAWPIDFLMWYGLSANLYLAFFYSRLSGVVPDRWKRLLDKGCSLQLLFAALFLIALFAFKVTGIM